MNPLRVQTWLAVAALSSLVGFSTTYAWQARRGAQPQQVTNPADVLGGWLRLMPGEIEQLRQVDPTFAADRAELEGNLAVERERLAGLFERDSAMDGEVLGQVERAIAAHDALERRVAKYLLALRPHLSAEQRSRLFDRCANGVRKAGGWRWRHGQSGVDSSERRGGGPPPGRGFGRGRGGGGLSAPVSPQSTSRPAGESP